MVLPPPSTFAFRDTFLLRQPAGCLLSTWATVSFRPRPARSILHTPQLANRLVLPLPLAPLLPLTPVPAIFRPCAFGTFSEHPPPLSWQSASRVIEWSIDLFSMPDCQLLEGSLCISFISDSLGLSTEPGPVNTQQTSVCSVCAQPN